MIYGVVVDSANGRQLKGNRAITHVKQSAAGYGNYQDCRAKYEPLKQQVSLAKIIWFQIADFVWPTGTPAQAVLVGEFERVGVNLLLLQCSPNRRNGAIFEAAINKKARRLQFDIYKPPPLRKKSSGQKKKIRQPFRYK